MKSFSMYLVMATVFAKKIWSLNSGWSVKNIQIDSTREFLRNKKKRR